jgi:nucleoside-diphosphate-sugar epimerase
MNILITGATGNIGLEVLKQLASKNHRITVLARNSKKNIKLLRQFEGVKVIYGDITSPNAVNKACKNQDYAIHLAAIIPPFDSKNQVLAKKVNLEGTRNIIRGLEKLSPNCFLIFSSSVTVYGDRLKTPRISVNDPIQTTKWDKYGQAKIDSENLIKNSTLNWTIYRLNAIMGIGNHKLSKILFHVPLNTLMEIATVDDTARAFVNSIGKKKELSKHIFNLGGGELCVITYQDFLNRAFRAFGLGSASFPYKTFAEANFHCGIYADGNDLEEILSFRADTIETYFDQFNGSVPKFQRAITRPFGPLAKKLLCLMSEPRKAFKTKNKDLVLRFFGEHNKDLFF